jgi:hypothetical protein
VTSELQEADWNRLLRRIQSGKCTPFLGAGACYGALPLGAGVAEELVQRYGYPISGSRSCACCAVRGSAIRPERAKRRRRRHSARRRSAKVQPAATVRDLTLTSWSGVRILDLRDGNSQFGPPTFRDQFIRILPGPRCSDN